MRLTFWILGAGVALLGTAACSDKKTEVAGEGDTVSAGTAKSGLPHYAPLYEDATILSSTEGTTPGVEGGQKGGQVVFMSKFSPATIAKFYRKKLKSSGLAEHTETEEGGTIMLSTSSEAGKADGAQVTIAPHPAGSKVTITYAG